jgi:hypothetical protein
LEDDATALSHLREAQAKAIEAIANAADGHVELDIVIAQVGVRASDVVRNAAGS